MRVSRASGVGHQGPRERARRGGVAGQSPPPRNVRADVAQLAEHVLGKDEVTGSIPVIGSRFEGKWQERLDGAQGSMNE